MIDKKIHLFNKYGNNLCLLHLSLFSIETKRLTMGSLSQC